MRICICCFSVEGKASIFPHSQVIGTSQYAHEEPLIPHKLYEPNNVSCPACKKFFVYVLVR